MPERRARSWAKARASPGEQTLYFMQAAVDARSFLLTIHNRSKVICELPVQGPPRLCNFVAPMQPLDCLLRAERDKYTENDDSDLAGERAPAVKWLGQMEMHAGAPSEARTLTEVLVSAMVEAGPARWMFVPLHVS